MSAVFAAPDEILLQIILELHLRDVLALRKTCTRLSLLTQDREAWLQVLREQSRSVPLPYHLRLPSSWRSLSSADAETVVSRLHTVDRTWLLPRPQYFVPAHHSSCAVDPVFNNDVGPRTIYSVDIFLDRWLLCIYHEKVVELWDLDSAVHEPHKPLFCASHQIGGIGSFSSAITHLNEEDNILTIAVSCHELCHVIQIELYPSSVIDPRRHNGADQVRIRNVAEISFSSPTFCLRAIYPEQSLLLLGLPSSFHLLNWETRRWSVVTTRSEDEEELWNGVIGATFLTPRHILVLKAHSLEICTLIEGRAQPQVHPPDEALNSSHAQPPMSAAIHSHYFPGTTFRGVCFSRPLSRVERVTKGDADSENTHVTLSFLAYDVLRGLFHCCASIVIPSSPEPRMPYTACPPLDVQVSLLAAHNMAAPITVGRQGTHAPRSGFSYGSRGFVSACSLGPSGRRGVWVERRRGAVRRVVYGFSAVPEDDPRVFGGEGTVGPPTRGNNVVAFAAHPPADTDADGDSFHPSWNPQTAPAIEGKEIYDVNSYDLRDDITHIAFSETTGVIALGTRKGEIRVLGRSL